VRRPIRWVSYHRIYNLPVIKFFFVHSKAIPIAPAHEDEKLLEQAFEAIARELADGQLVGIFPEGKLTSDGEMNEFRTGVTRILERTPVPVVPVALSGLWRSVFSRGRARLRYTTKLFPRVRLAVGEPMTPAAATPQALHAAVLALRGDWR